MVEQNRQLEANDSTDERPEVLDYYSQEPKVTYTDEELDKKWYGVPPAGERPLMEKWKYVLLVIGVIITEICIWGVYRYFTAPIFENFGTYQFYLFHIIAAPTIHLGPILIFWKIVRKERGIPFVFTKKLILTGILFGFISAIIWRLIEEFAYFGFSSGAGGVTGSLTFWNVLESADLFVLMTFVMYFIVGPVEELEFRGFTQDQAARALPNWQALIISSVLFGCSHIPIALFIYKFTPTQFIDALFGWIAAGFTFGFLYMWSRNIFACIVMHAMGNWQLSVFYFSAPTVLDPIASMGVGIATSIVANVLMILIFYFIFKYYWEPHRHGEPAFGGILLSIQKRLYDHDFERKPVTMTVAIFVIIIMIISGVIMGATVSMGVNYYAGVPQTDTGGSTDISDYFEVEQLDSGSGTLQEGQSTTLTTTAGDQGFIRSVSVTVTWTDEEDMRRVRTYENQPDTFSVSITFMNTTVDAEGSNPHGSQGSINALLTFTDEELEEIAASGLDSAMSSEIVITMVNAGNFVPGVGVIGYTDSGNDFEYVITMVWLSPTEVTNEEQETN